MNVFEGEEITAGSHNMMQENNIRHDLLGDFLLMGTAGRDD